LSATDAPWPSPAVRWYGVGMLSVAYVLSFVDRTILTLLVEPIRRDLGLTDTQISLLHGLAFAVLYTTVGIPVARLSDTRSRRALIAAGVALWSLATAACGLAKGFWSLFLGRVGVGIGESTLSPAAYSLFADSFPPDRLGAALGVYNGAIYVGAGLAMLIGGAVVQAALSIGAVAVPLVGDVNAWQLVFFAVGLPGLMLAPLVLTVHEPARRAAPRADGRTGFVATLAWMRTHRRVYVGHVAGFSLISAVYNVAVAWGPTFMIRRFGDDPASAGHSLGLVLLVCGATGAITGGLVADALRRRGRLDAALIVGVASALLVAVPGTLATLQTTATAYLALAGAALFCASLAFGAAATALQLVTPGHLRAQVSAVYLLALNLFALGLAPLAAALLTDYAFRDPAHVGTSVAIVSAVCAPLGAACLMWARAPFRRLAGGSVEARGATAAPTPVLADTRG
jgi:MFS family permease